MLGRRQSLRETPTSRDMCKVLQGLLKARSGKGGIETKVGLLKLWTNFVFMKLFHNAVS
jgi:hypothetical protein